MDADAENEGPLRRVTPPRPLLIWAVVAFLWTPPTIVLHELGHFAAAKAFRFPGVRLHYGSVADKAKEARRPAWQRGVKSAAGPVVTVLLVLSGCLATRHFGPQPLATGLGLAAGVRSVLIGAAFVFWRVTQGPMTQGGFDEAQVARHLHLPTELVVAGFTLAILAGWVHLARALPRPGRWSILAANALGIGAGVGFWSAIGPWLLP